MANFHIMLYNLQLLNECLGCLAKNDGLAHNLSYNTNKCDRDRCNIQVLDIQKEKVL